MKGFRTILFNLLGVVAVPGLTYLVGLDWTQYVSPTIALIIVGGINIGLRYVTNSPVFKKEPE